MSTQTKLTQAQLNRMSSKKLANYLTEITQTPICKDKKYCNMVVAAFIKSA